MRPSQTIEVAIVRKLPLVGSLHFSTRLRAHRKICGNRLPQLAPRLPRCKKRSLAPESIGSDPYSLGAVLFVGRLPCQSASHEDRDIGLGGGARLGTIGIAANSTASCWPRLAINVNASGANTQRDPDTRRFQFTSNPLVTSARVFRTLGTIDERLTRYCVSRSALLQFCSSLRMQVSRSCLHVYATRTANL